MFAVNSLTLRMDLIITAPIARSTGCANKHIVIHTLACMVSAYSPSAPKMTIKTAPNTKTRDSQSCVFMVSPSRLTASKHTIIGIRLQTMPTVETLKYFTNMKLMYTERPLWRHLNMRLGTRARSTEANIVYFKSLLSHKTRIMVARKARANPSCMTAMEGLRSRSALLT